MKILGKKESVVLDMVALDWVHYHSLSRSCHYIDIAEADSYAGSEFST